MFINLYTCFIPLFLSFLDNSDVIIFELVEHEENTTKQAL